MWGGIQSLDKILIIRVLDCKPKIKLSAMEDYYYGSIDDENSDQYSDRVDDDDEEDSVDGLQDQELCSKDPSCTV